jgi:hypothetical protein
MPSSLQSLVVHNFVWGLKIDTRKSNILSIIQISLILRMSQLLKRTRDKFLPEEDAELRRLVEKHGTTAWDAVASELPNRNPRQCRERWKHYLSSERAKVPWMPEEDRLLFEKMQTVGPRWTRLAAFFPGRTDIEVKTHWMQRFASHSNLHVLNRARPMRPLPPMATPIQQPQTHVQFRPLPMQPGLIPKAPTPSGDVDWMLGPSRDPSFSSRSFYDFNQLGD